MTAGSAPWSTIAGSQLAAGDPACNRIIPRLAAPLVPASRGSPAPPGPEQIPGNGVLATRFPAGLMCCRAGDAPALLVPVSFGGTELAPWPGLSPARATVR